MQYSSNVALVVLFHHIISPLWNNIHHDVVWVRGEFWSLMISSAVFELSLFDRTVVETWTARDKIHHCH